MTRLLAITTLALALAQGCRENPATSNEKDSNQTKYTVIEGACGNIFYQEKIATNFETAYGEIEKRKTEYFSKHCPNAPCHEIKLEYYQIEVVDENNIAPSEQFFAIQVLDKHTKMLLHSVSEVITNDGDLYRLTWCPDDKAMLKLVAP